MKFLEKNKKWLFLSSIILLCGSFGLSLLGYVLKAILLVLRLPNYAPLELGTEVLHIGGNMFFLVLILAAFIAVALACWKNRTGKWFLAGAGALMLLQIGFQFLLQIDYFVIYRFFRIETLIDLFFDNSIQIVLAAYLILFSFLKCRGAIVPALGIGLIVVGFGFTTFSILESMLHNISYVLEYEYWEASGAVVGNLLSMFNIAMDSLGKLLLVPLAMYIPKRKAEPYLGEEITFAESAQ